MGLCPSYSSTQEIILTTSKQNTKGSLPTTQRMGLHVQTCIANRLTNASRTYKLEDGLLNMRNAPHIICALHKLVRTSKLHVSRGLPAFNAFNTYLTNYNVGTNSGYAYNISRILTRFHTQYHMPVVITHIHRLTVILLITSTTM